MSKYSFILNPNAGKGRGERLLQPLKAELAKNHLDADVFITERSGHATEIARKALGQIIVAIGGDGTANEVANGIVGSTKTLGIIPNGSGNDLIKSIGIPSDFPSAFEKIMVGKTRRIDCASVKCTQSKDASGTSNSNERYFVNGVGIGFDAAVAERTSHIKYIGGTAVYLLAVFQTLGRYASPDFTIKLDSSLRRSRNLLIAIGNGRCAGGGFYLTPQALVDDGFLDVCMIDDISVTKILMIMPKVMKGKHEANEAVTMNRAKRISVSAEQPFFVHADGEIVGRNVNSADVQIAEKSLNVIVG